MQVGIVGLGLIGGSFARAYQEKGHQVYGFDRDAAVLELAQMAGVLDGILDRDTLPDCQLVIIALYPQATLDWLDQYAPTIARDTLVLDTCGVKRCICPHCFALARQYGFSFVGGHPMAGTQFSGFKFSRASLFKGASMVLVPEHRDDITFFEWVKRLLEPAEFGRLTFATAEEHDEMIAFTSQLAHVVSNAYIKSPTARRHKGFSAGSYKDLTRVAWLNETMWAELFLDNRDYLLKELDGLLSALEAYRTALAGKDRHNLLVLLAEGKQRKEELDLNGPRS